MRPPFLTAHYDELSAAQIEQIARRIVYRTIIQANGCWEVQGQPVHSGHIQIAHGSPKRLPWVRVRAHVFAWEVANKRSVPAGHVVMHSCDQPRCVNPEHLHIGTQGDNVRDSICKGRYNVFGHQRLNSAHVREIRQRVARGELQKDIARVFGVARNTISGIVTGASWGHVDPLDAIFERVPTVLLPIRGEVR